MKKLENKCALVTSATRGIGLACALALAHEGAAVYIGARQMDYAYELCSKYSEKGYKLHPVYFDATDKSCYEKMVKEVADKENYIDILVNNFGIGKPAQDLDLLNGNENAFFEIMDLNLGSVYRITKLVLPYMIEQKSGSIINISSIGGIIPDITRIGYGVSKAAINNITKQIAIQYAKYNIRCNAVLPGLTATEAALKNMPQDFINSFLSHVPLNRIGKPEDIGNAVLFLSSDDSSYITGHILDVAGGYGIGTPQYSETVK